MSKEPDFEKKFSLKLYAEFRSKQVGYTLSKSLRSKLHHGGIIESYFEEEMKNH